MDSKGAELRGVRDYMNSGFSETKSTVRYIVMSAKRGSTVYTIYALKMRVNYLYFQIGFTTHTKP